VFPWSPSLGPIAGDAALRHHGDADTVPGCVDLAVNVRAGTPPEWLRHLVRASVDELAGYPNPTPARAAVAGRHHRPAEEVLLTAGAAEAFVLLARALRPRHPVVVHPQFTEPEAALLAAGHAVDRAVLSWPFTLDPPPVISEDADLVVVGNPTNPTSVLHPAESIAALARPWRILVVDEAFMDAVPGERESLAGRRDVPGLVIVRSLTKTWGLAGLRIGYLLAAREIVDRLAAVQPLWAVSTPSAVAAVACCSDRARAETGVWADALARDRDALLDALATRTPEVEVVPRPSAPFLALRLPGRADGAAVLGRLRALGFAARRGDTFPGLGAGWLRIAVRDPRTSVRFAAALATALSGAPPVSGPGEPPPAAGELPQVGNEPPTDDHPGDDR